jgi:hypothetical protein
MLPAAELAAFRADGVVYRDTGAGYLTAMYDRLLGSEGQLAGVQLWCVLEAAGLGAALAGLPADSRPYLVRYQDSPLVVGVLLQALALGEAERLEGGGEQAFGGQVFRGEDGSVAVTIDLGYLLGGGASGEADLAAVRAASAHWLTITEPVEPQVAEA